VAVGNLTKHEARWNYSSGPRLDSIARLGLAAAKARPVPLPISLSTYIPRTNDLEQLHALLETHRLVTLTGPGGVGKTRLALQLALELQDTFADGIHFVDIAPLRDARLLEGQVLRSLGVHEERGQPTDSLIELLRSRSVLLILDNCEHLIESCACLAELLLARCKQVRLLATSREALDIDGERLWRVLPLEVIRPDSCKGLEEVAAVPAVQLFVVRAQAVEPAFRLSDDNASVVAEVCWRLDGLPLAIELAANRVPVLSVQQIADRLRDSLRLLGNGRRSAPDRHQTLRGLLDWSYALLPPPERHLFDRLSVFAGDWTLEEAEVVCAGDEIAPGDVLDLVARLVNKSLILSLSDADAARYRQLETLRQFGHLHLQASGEEHLVHRRHAEYFTALAESAARAWRTPAQTIWLRRLAPAHDNLRAALDWHLANRPEAGLRLAHNLLWFWERSGRVREARQWLDSLLTRTSQDDPLRAATLVASGHLALVEGNMLTAQRVLADALQLAQHQHDERVLGAALTQLARVNNRLGDAQMAQALCNESLSMARAVDDPQVETDALINAGIVAAEQGNTTAARIAYEEAIGRARDAGDDWSRALALRSLGHIARVEGDADAARALFEEALGIWKELDDPWGIAWSLSGLGYLAIEAGHHLSAEELFRASLQLRKFVGARGSLANSLEGFASLAAARGDSGRAYRLAGAVLQLRASMGERPPAAEQTAFLRTLEGARLHLSRRQCDAAVASGAAMTLDQAINFALERESDPNGSLTMDRPFDGAALTPRERQVLVLLQRGLSNKQIAETLVVGVRTAETHVERVLRKLNLRSRSELIART